VSCCDTTLTLVRHKTIVGTRIASLIKAQRISKAEAARRCQTDVRTISRLIAYTNDPNITTAFQVADGLKTTVDQLFIRR